MRVVYLTNIEAYENNFHKLAGQFCKTCSLDDKLNHNEANRFLSFSRYRSLSLYCVSITLTASSIASVAASFLLTPLS